MNITIQEKNLFGLEKEEHEGYPDNFYRTDLPIEKILQITKHNLS